MGDVTVGMVEGLLVFTLDDQRYALRLEHVERVVRAVEVTPLPGAPECILGIIDVQGGIVPVIDMRRRFLLPEKEVSPGDQFVIASTMGRKLALVADRVHGVVECGVQTIVPADRIVSRLESFEGVTILADGMVLITDIDKLLSAGDEAALADQLSALDRSGPEAGEGPREQPYEC